MGDIEGGIELQTFVRIPKSFFFQHAINKNIKESQFHKNHKNFDDLKYGHLYGKEVSIYKNDNLVKTGVVKKINAAYGIIEDENIFFADHELPISDFDEIKFPLLQSNVSPENYEIIMDEDRKRRKGGSRKRKTKRRKSRKSRKSRKRY